MIRVLGAVRLRRDDESGISIVELVVAVAILGITMMGIAMMVMNSLNVSRSNANRVVAANIAASEIEAHLALTFNELLARLGESVLDPVEVDGRQFEVTRDIYWSTNEADLGPCISGEASAADENVLRIDISVTWTRTLGVQPVVSSTTVSPPVDTFGSAGGTIAVFVVDDENEPMAGVSTRLFGPVETSPITSPVVVTDEHGCAVFEGLGIGSYQAVIARHTADTEPPYVDIDQRRSAYPIPSTHSSVDPSSVMTLTGVSPRSRVTTEFFYAQAHELTVTAAGWDGGHVPDGGFTWHYVDTRGEYVGGTLGESAYVYPTEYELWAGSCSVADPRSQLTVEVEGDDPSTVDRWPGAARDSATARPSGGSTEVSVTFGTFDVVWDEAVTADPTRQIGLRAVPLQECSSSPEVELGTTTLGQDTRFALPWGDWRIVASEGSTTVAQGAVQLAPADQEGIPPVVTLDVVEVLEPGPAGVTGPIVWFDADDPLSVTATGGAVSEWRDQTSNERHAVQSTSANRPQYVANQLNGRPVVRFDGTTSFMSYDGEALAGTDYTVFAVNRRLSTGVHRYYLGGTTAATNRNLFLGYWSNEGQEHLRHSHWAHTHDQVVTSYAPGEQARVHAFVFDQNVGKSTYQDGGLVGSATAGNDRLALTDNLGAQLGRILSGGAAQYFHGDIAEVVIYDRALSDEERDAVEQYLHSKWISTPAFQPNQMSGLQLWLDAADDVTLRQDLDCSQVVASGADRVRCWLDKSGNSRHATRNGDGSRPTAAFGALNGRTAVRFNGSSQFLEYDGEFLGNTDYTVAIVTRRTGTGTGTTYNFYLGGQNDVGNNRNLHLGYRNNTRLDHAQWGNDYGTTVPGWTNGEPAKLHTFELRGSGAGSGKRIFENGSQVASTGNTTRLSSYPNARIGRFLTSYFQGDIAEVVIYNRALSNAERAQLEQYLSAKWGIS